MSRQSEEVLLIVNHVKNKKVDGMLYMMGERLAWMQASKQSFTYSHPYADIKGIYAHLLVNRQTIMKQLLVNEYCEII